MTEEKKIATTNPADGKNKFAGHAPAMPAQGERTQDSHAALPTVASTVSTLGLVVGEPFGTTSDLGLEPMGVSAAIMRSSSVKQKKKAEIETLEHFILRAYSLKGRKVQLSGAIEKRIGRKPTLDTAAVERMLTKSHGDLLFVVPRQLLLVARDIQAYPALRGALEGFVKTAMLAHPLFANPLTAAAINNLPEAPSMIEAMSALACSELPLELRSADKPAIKQAQFTELRANAVYCLAVWFRNTRGASVSELNDALYRALWSRAAADMRDEGAKLRALTELRDLAATGLACIEFQTVATERTRQMNDAQQTVSQAQAKIYTLKNEVEQLRDTHSMQIAQFESQVQNLKALAEKNQAESQHALTHLRDDLEQLRTRVLRRLKADVVLLDEGLTALRRNPPKIHVMDDHVERVADALRQEIKKLESGG